jgi:hypothetical protein
VLVGPVVLQAMVELECIHRDYGVAGSGARAGPAGVVCTQHAQQLAFLLWPDSTDAQARTNPRTLVRRLRAALPAGDAVLTGDAHSLWWRTEVAVTLDVVEFEAALAAARPAL